MKKGTGRVILFVLLIARPCAFRPDAGTSASKRWKPKRGSKKPFSEPKSPRKRQLEMRPEFLKWTIESKTWKRR